jgi:hypothetical protein
VEAVAAAKTAASLWRPLAKKEPKLHSRDLAHTLYNFGPYSDKIGQRKEANDAMTETVKSYRELADTQQNRSDLIGALTRMAEILRLLGRTQEADTAAAEAKAAAQA